MPMPRIITASIVAALLVACGDGGDGRSDPASAAATPAVCEYDYEVALIGDSHTWMPGYSTQVVWEYPEGEVMNFALFGLTTEDWLPDGELYAESLFAERVPRVASILLSTNDANPILRDPEVVIENLIALTDALLADGVCRVVIMTPPPFFFPIQEVKDLLAWYSEDIRWLCGDPDDDIDCGPDLQAILGSEHILDGQHPNPFGHAVIARALIPMLEPR